jgi:transposase-like protein
MISSIQHRALAIAVSKAARAVEGEGEVLDILVQPRRARKAALKLMRNLLKKQGITPTTIVTDKLGSYGAALREGRQGRARRRQIPDGIDHPAAVTPPFSQVE